jgi:hypothetical protein
VHVLRPAHGLRVRLVDGSEVSAERPPLPLDEAEVEQLERRARRAVGEVWLGRAQSELRVGAKFEQIRVGLAARIASESSAALQAAAVDETRHSELCALVATRYAGGPLSWVPPPPEPPLARFGEADEALSALLHLVLQSCINESVSTLYLRSAMKLSRAALAREALRQLLSDDVEHARLGWAYLASSQVTPSDRLHVAHALPTLLRLARAAWTDVPERAESWFVEHGCAGREVARAAFEDGVKDVVLPGLSHVGVSPEHGEAWLKAQA